MTSLINELSCKNKGKIFTYILLMTDFNDDFLELIETLKDCLKKSVNH